MSKQKKHKPHTCIHHSGQIARGRCVRCHAWICSACGSFNNGQFSCIKACMALPPASPSQPEASASITIASRPLESAAPENALKPESSQAQAQIPKKQAAFKLSALVLLAGWTTGLLGLAFGLWELHQNDQLRGELTVLKARRLELIDHIKNINIKAAKLQEELAGRPANNAPVPTAPAQEAPLEKTRTFVDNAISGTGPGGVPLSFTNGTIHKKTVSLTFDGGSYSNAAGAILDTLKTRHICATIFATGEFISRNPELMRRMLSEGHEVGNHTQRHPHLTAYETLKIQRTLPGITQELLCRELAQANAAFFRVTGQIMAPLWRAPYGEINSRLCQWAQACGYIHIGWRQGRSWRDNLDSNDWIASENEKGYHSPQDVLNKILAAAHAAPDGISGGIILMHLGTDRKEQTQQVHHILGALIDSLTALNYAIIPVSKMLQESGVNVSALPARDSTDAGVLSDKVSP